MKVGQLGELLNAVIFNFSQVPGVYARGEFMVIYNPAFDSRLSS